MRILLGSGWFLLLLSIFAFAPSRDAMAVDKNVYDLPPTVAIQNRRYEMPQSLVLTAGYIPTDSFNRGFTFTGAYRYAFTSYLTWEIISFSYVANHETDLKKQIENLSNQNAAVSVQNVGLGGILDYPRQIYMTGLMYAPWYSKSLLFNSKLTFSETSLFLGIGSLNFNQTGYKPMLAPGITTRLYITPSTAMTAYFRDYFYDDSNTGITGIIDIGIGLEFKFGGDSKSPSVAMP